MNKVPVFEWFYTQGDLLVTVTTALESVDVPANLKRQEVVDFILGAVPTPKLSFDEIGIKTPMRFSGKLHNCYFSWESIIQMSSQDAVIQFRNKHAEKEVDMAQQSVKPAAGTTKKPGRANLRVVK
ncbi:hypothetical protein MNBD_NITROSPINAE01-1709 [hydrothermal vent metagenome]|uniref:Uncharacterized protein n=1 Tax=hydrothermal vent metagenome TaxID=652676 RepID=A0A3B1C4A3_9ZZZZ